MASNVSISTDHVAAFVALAQHNSLRRAAQALNITEQGLRNRLLVLEQRLGTELYRKNQGGYSAGSLTERGREFLPQAKSFIEQSQELFSFFAENKQALEIRVAASQFLTTYLLIDALKEFGRTNPKICVHLSCRTSREIEESLLSDNNLSLGVVTPYEPSTQLSYQHLFALRWGVVLPLHHRLSAREKINLSELATEPLILYERGSAGRRQLIEAFNRNGFSPNVRAETTNTEIILRMVEANLGVSIIPLLPNKSVTKNRSVKVCGLNESIESLTVGLLTRKGERLLPAAESFAELLRKTIKE